MTKKLYVPDPEALKKAFGKDKEPSKNENDPSEMDVSALERLPQPTGYRMLIIPYYPPQQTKGGLYVPDAVRDREAFATVAAYVVKLGPDAYQDQQKFPTGP